MQRDGRTVRCETKKAPSSTSIGDLSKETRSCDFHHGVYNTGAKRVSTTFGSSLLFCRMHNLLDKRVNVSSLMSSHSDFHSTVERLGMCEMLL